MAGKVEEVAAELPDDVDKKAEKAGGSKKDDKRDCKHGDHVLALWLEEEDDWREAEVARPPRSIFCPPAGAPPPLPLLPCARGHTPTRTALRIDAQVPCSGRPQARARPMMMSAQPESALDHSARLDPWLRAQAAARGGWERQGSACAMTRYCLFWST